VKPGGREGDRAALGLFGPGTAYLPEATNASKTAISRKATPRYASVPIAPSRDSARVRLVELAIALPADFATSPSTSPYAAIPTPQPAKVARARRRSRPDGPNRSVVRGAELVWSLITLDPRSRSPARQIVRKLKTAVSPTTGRERVDGVPSAAGAPRPTRAVRSIGANRGRCPSRRPCGARSSRRGRQPP